EIHANEIVLLSYYIAAVNIEETFKHVYETDEYYPFNGIVLTDTFETSEQKETLVDKIFGINNERIIKQKETPITIIMENPPYSRGQNSSNDNVERDHYPLLDKRIEDTYAKFTTATLKNPLYDSVIRAIRWA